MLGHPSVHRKSLKRQGVFYAFALLPNLPYSGVELLNTNAPLPSDWEACSEHFQSQILPASLASNLPRSQAAGVARCCSPAPRYLKYLHDIFWSEVLRPNRWLHSMSEWRRREGGETRAREKGRLKKKSKGMVGDFCHQVSHKQAAMKYGISQHDT